MTRPAPLRKVVRGLGGDTLVVGPDRFSDEAAFIELYPAEPRTTPRGDCPSLCFRPMQCAGKTACPQRYSCSE